MAEHLFIIAGMALVTYVCRVVPLLLLSSRELNPALMRWLEMVPPAVLAALLAPELLLHPGTNGEPQFFINMDNTFLIAAIPTVAIGLLSKSFFATVATGMVLVALLRALL